MKGIKTSVLRIIKKLSKNGSKKAGQKVKKKKKKTKERERDLNENVNAGGGKSANHHLGDYKKNLSMPLGEGQMDPTTYDDTPPHQVLEPIFLGELGDYDFSYPTGFLLNTTQNLGGDLC